MPDPSPILKAVCPECGAGLKTNNPAGFKPGQTLTCPKCETYFAVEDPAAPPVAAAKPVKKAVAAVVDDEEDDDDDVDKPVRKKGNKKAKAGTDGDERGGYAKYRKSPIRFIILGVLVVIMIVMSVLLYLKWENQKKADQEFESSRFECRRLFRTDA